MASITNSGRCSISLFLAKNGTGVVFAMGREDRNDDLYSKLRQNHVY